MFCEDSRTERFLTSIGVKWSYSNEITFSSLIPDWPQQNIGRSQLRVQAAVSEYGLMMERGSAAPAPILWRNLDKIPKLEVLDGIQRLHAERERNPSRFSAYIVETDSIATVRTIRLFANYRLQGGHQESSEWTLRQAVKILIGQFAMTIEDVAAMGGWPPAAVRDKKECFDCSDAIQAVGGPESFPDSILRIIAKHSQKTDFASAPVPMAEFTNSLRYMRLSADEAEPYIEEFFSIPRSKGRLHEQFSEKVREFKSDEDVAYRLADPSRRRYQPTTAEGRLMKSLKATLTTAERVLDSGERIPFTSDYFQIVNRIRKVLQQIEAHSRKK